MEEVWSRSASLSTETDFGEDGMLEYEADTSDGAGLPLEAGECSGAGRSILRMIDSEPTLSHH